MGRSFPFVFVFFFGLLPFSLWHLSQGLDYIDEMFAYKVQCWRCCLGFYVLRSMLIALSASNFV